MTVAGTDVPRWTDAEVRADRRALLAERAQLLRWRRLLRSRLDLTVARLAPPDHLGEYAWDLLPTAQLALPSTAEILQAVTGCPGRGADAVDTMEQLRSLDRRLAVYQDELDRAIEERTARVVDTLAESAEPCLGEGDLLAD